MILYIKNHTSKEQRRYILNTVEDFEEVFQLYPYTKTIALKSDGVDDAANKIAKYLSDSSRFDAWIEGTVMKSSVHNAALALGLATMPVSVGGRVLEQPTQNDMTEQEHSGEEFGKAPEDPFLWNIMQVESSGGRDTEHKQVTNGPQKGQTAMGRWGLLPNTVKDVLDRLKIKGKLTNDLRPLYNMNQTQLKQHFEHNPTSELKVARSLAHHVLTNNKGDAQRAAFSWLHGSNLTKEHIQDDQLSGSDYVQKFKSWHPANPYKKKDLQVKKHLPKKESASEFKDRIKIWSMTREEAVRQHLPHDSTYTNDPGRLRNKKLDEKKPSGIKGAIAWAIKQAKKDNKKD